jgi:hypothetical protein
MEWHIITGSKGGVGKTLLSLLLLAYHLEEKVNEGILVLDLNAMNTDTAAMLLYGNMFCETLDIELERSQRIIALQKATSQYNHFVVGWTANPFLLYEYDHFADLLSSIKQHAQTISERFEIKPLKHVIIDTNYHFCNLFPPQDEQYEKYLKSGDDDHFNIWFLWVYRQLTKLLERKDNESDVFIKTVGAIERCLKPVRGKIGPLIHTYAALSLLPTEAKQGGFLGWGKENLPDRSQDYSIPALEKLEHLEKIGKYLVLKEWISKLQEAKQSVLSDIEKSRLIIEREDTHRVFSAMLDRAIDEIAQDEFLPINVFPLSLYQPTLEGYTDRERADIVARLRNLETYKRFKNLLDCKFGNEL